MNRTIDGHSSSTTIDLLTNDTFIEESLLSTTDKKRKIKDTYTSHKWLEENEYEVIKIQRTVRNKIFRHIKFYEYDIMKEVGLDKNNTTLSERKLW